MDVISYTRRATAANMSLARSTMRIGEVMMAAATVVNVRGNMMAEGMRSPLDANWREFQKMVPEKITAFGKSGAATADEFKAIRSGLIDDWQRVMTSPFSKTSAAQAPHVATRMASIGLEMLELTARLAEVAIEPIHRTVTANAKRLG